MKKKKSGFNKKSTRKAIKRLVKQGFSESEAKVIINRYADKAVSEIGGKA